MLGAGRESLGPVFDAPPAHPPGEGRGDVGEVLGAPVSTGFLAGLATLGGRLLAPFVSRAKELLAVNPVIHADETTIRVSSEGWWLHVMACTTVILLVCHQHRGHEAIDAIGVLPGYDGIVVHDGLAAYDYLEKARHAQCCAHLLRHLGKAMSHDDTKLWARSMTEALLDWPGRRARAAGEGRELSRPPARAASQGAIPSRDRRGFPDLARRATTPVAQHWGMGTPSTRLLQLGAPFP